MSQQNPFQAVLKACESFSHCVHTHLSHLFVPTNLDQANHLPGKSPSLPPPLVVRSSKTTSSTSDVSALLAPQPDESLTESAPSIKGKSAVPLTKEEVGRATWTLLHSIAAQFPDQPSRQQKRDVKELMAIISRIYPCKECADHFKEILKASPVQAGSHGEFSQWLCHVHNVVNRSLGKLTFPCQRVDARWGKLDCPDRSCDVEGGSEFS